MTEQRNKGGIGRRLLSALLAAVAAKAALKLLEGIWTKGAGRPLPDETEEHSVSEKVVWVALAAAAAAAARELTKEIVNPPGVEA